MSQNKNSNFQNDQKDPKWADKQSPQAGRTESPVGSQGKSDKFAQGDRSTSAKSPPQDKKMGQPDRSER